MTPPNIPLKDKRMMSGRTLVQVAAEAGCSVGYVRQYEILPESLADARKRRKLDDIYSRFLNTEAA
jgi:hypothetical protein